MFDFFKDMYFEMAGVDIQSIKKEREEKRKEEKKNRYIFSKNAKLITIAMGVLYLLIAGFEIALLVHFSGSVLLIIKLILQIIIDIAVIICLGSKKKEYEKIALTLIVIFLVFGYMSVFIV